MQIPAFLVPLIVGINWLAGVMLFERLHQKGFFARVLPEYDKPKCCKVWVIGETFLYLLCGPVAFMFALLMLWTIGVSHLFLSTAKNSVSTNKDSVITVIEVIRNVPSAMKRAIVIIRPYIK